MTLRITVSGFRSLKEFSVTIDQGLNVVLGPNGSGKSNFVSALEFFSRFSSGGMRSAIGTAGGATRVFRHENILQAKNEKGKARRRANLTFRIEGTLKVPNPLRMNSRKNDEPEFVSGRIDYLLALSLSVDDFSVRVDHEQLSFVSDGPFRSRFEIGTFGLVATSLRKVGNSSYGLSDEFLKRQMNRYLGDDLEIDAISDINSAIYFNAKSGNSIFSMGPYNGLIATLRRTLAFPRSVNIVPDKVRTQDDIASANFLTADGTGVIATLHEMLQKPNSRVYHMDNMDPETYERIVDVFKRVNENILDVEIAPNFETGRLECSVFMDDEEKPVKLPFSWLSDGTVKWLAIITLVSLRSGGYCLEEPENYLHPRAQRVFFEYLRGVVESNPSAFMVVTTHSETIINCARIEELILTEYNEGKTSSRKVGNPENVLALINETGFGLGYFYTVGDLNDA